MEPDKVVVVVLKGGIGNQLFQYAAAVTAAGRIGASVVVRRPATDGFALDELLGTELPQASRHALRRIALESSSQGLSRQIQLIRRRTLSSLDKVLYVRQTSQGAHLPMPELTLAMNGRGVYMDGYFQNPTWFDASLQDVATQLGTQLSKAAGPEFGRDATVISFRRGDYVRLGWELPISYYHKALDSLPPLSGPIWVIGDDQLVTDLIRTWLDHRGAKTHNLPDLGVDRSLRDLALLMAADRVVMSNSSYCWWGVNAVDPLSNRSDRTIIAPAAWVPVPGSTALVRSQWNAISSPP